VRFPVKISIVQTNHLIISHNFMAPKYNALQMVRCNCGSRFKDLMATGLIIQGALYCYGIYTQGANFVTYAKCSRFRVVVMARHIPSRFGKCQADLASKTHTTTGNQSPRAHKSVVK
jgi:hypothetical protein